MGNAQAEIKKACRRATGRCTAYNPDLAAQGKNPMTLDSKDPTGNYQEFLAGETRYASLAKMFPEAAQKLFAQSEQDAARRLESYKAWLPTTD